MNARRIAVAAALAAAWGMMALGVVAAQVPPAEVEKQLEYARCIRANGYAEFPDPGPDGRTRIRIDPKSGPRFEAAQRACKDKIPGGLAAAEQNMTPERMQALLAFAACVRGKGVKGFPDPSPQGVFELTGSANRGTPQVEQAVQACTASHPPGGLLIRMSRPPQ